MTDAMHHLQKRKRTHKKLEPYPHPHFWKRFIDRLVYAVGFMVGAVTFIQVWKIWQEENADGVSLIAFSGYVIGDIVWVIYGLMHKEAPIVLMYGLLIFMNAAVVIGALIY